MRGLKTPGYHLAMGLISLLWVAPILWVIVISFRSFDDVAANGLGSLPHSFTFSTYKSAWEDADEFRALINSVGMEISFKTGRQLHWRQ